VATDQISVSSGSVSFVPRPGADPNAVARIRLTLRSSNPGPGTGTYVLSVPLSAPLPGPIAVGDAYAVSSGTALSVSSPGVLTNDLTRGGPALNAALVTTVAHGSLILAADGGFRYEASPGFIGLDTFWYRATNARGSSAPAPVRITVFASSSRPIAVDDTFVVVGGRELSVTSPGVLLNDQRNASPSLTSVLSTPVSNGTLELLSSGEFRYAPRSGFAGVDSFTYQAVGASGWSAPATVRITVEPGPTRVQPPTRLTATLVAGNTVLLQWVAPLNGPAPTAYVLEGGIGPGDVLASIATGSADPLVTLLVPTGSFYVRVHSVADSVRSDASNEIRIHVSVPVTPSPPEGLLGLVNGSTIGLAWRNTYEGGAPDAIVLDVTGSINTTIPLGSAESLVFHGVPSGVYTLRVRATNAAGGSEPSNAVTLSFPGQCSGAAGPPSRFVGARIGNTISLAWDPPESGAAPSSYELSVAGSFVGVIPVTGRSISGSVAPGTYSLALRSVNGCGKSAPVSTVVVVP